MNLLKDKRAFVDPEIIMNQGFWMLTILAVGATALGWIWGRNSGWESFPLWQVIIFMLIEVVVCYVIAAKMFD